MNERIQELIVKHFGLQLYYEGQAGQIEKFAELIVRECAGLATKEYNNRSSIHGNDLLKHFGVKE